MVNKLTADLPTFGLDYLAINCHLVKLKKRNFLTF